MLHSQINTSKRLPVVVAIDSTTLRRKNTSLGESEYEIATSILSKLLWDIRNHIKLKNSVEICFISTEKKTVSDFRLSNEWIINCAEKCQTLDEMVYCAYEKIDERVKKLENSEIGYYMPIIMFVGDENFEVVRPHNDKKNHINIVVVNIGKDMQSTLDTNELEKFGIPNMSVARRFDFRKIVQYILDIDIGDDRHLEVDDRCLHMMVKRFHEHSGELREQLSGIRIDRGGRSLYKISSSSEEIINSIRDDMDSLLADLAEE